MDFFLISSPSPRLAGLGWAGGLPPSPPPLSGVLVLRRPTVTSMRPEAQSSERDGRASSNRTTCAAAPAATEPRSPNLTDARQAAALALVTG
jgi:hypothetical protein